MVSFLTISVGKVTPAFAMAVGPLADPVYDTEIIAFKDYVEQNLSAPQLDIMFFLVGGLAVAQLGAQDAMLISPYPNEENVKEWLINCGIQLYNSVIGLVPEGDYYMGIPSIGTAGTKGVPRQVLKGLVAQMMGDAVVAINYRDLDDFLTQNPDDLYIPFNPDLQLGVNAVFGLNGGAPSWQFENRPFTTNLLWGHNELSGSLSATYTALVNELPEYRYLFSNSSNILTSSYSQGPYMQNCVLGSAVPLNFYLFLNTSTNKYYLVDTNGVQIEQGSTRAFDCVTYSARNNNVTKQTLNWTFNYRYGQSFDPSLTPSVIVNNIFNKYGENVYDLMYIRDSNGYYYSLFLPDIISRYFYGHSWEARTEIFNRTDLNFDADLQYYQQLQNDYLLDLRGLIGDLVNYVYVHQPVWDNIYDITGNLVLPDSIKVSVDLTPITDLLVPPLPVNMNDIAELTENTYLERVKEHARNAGDIFANYVAFWHNCDSDLVYTMFGAVILVLVGAFVGKWGHS